MQVLATSNTAVSRVGYHSVCHATETGFAVSELLPDFLHHFLLPVRCRVSSILEEVLVRNRFEQSSTKCLAMRSRSCQRGARSAERGPEDLSEVRSATSRSCSRGYCLDSCVHERTSLWGSTDFGNPRSSHRLPSYLLFKSSSRQMSPAHRCECVKSEARLYRC